MNTDYHRMALLKRRVRCVLYYQLGISYGTHMIFNGILEHLYTYAFSLIQVSHLVVTAFTQRSVIGRRLFQGEVSRMSLYFRRRDNMVDCSWMQERKVSTSQHGINYIAIVGLPTYIRGRMRIWHVAWNGALFACMRDIFKKRAA